MMAITTDSFCLQELHSVLFCHVTTYNLWSLPLILDMLYKKCQLIAGRAQFFRACVTKKGFAHQASYWIQSLAVEVAKGLNPEPAFGIICFPESY